MAKNTKLRTSLIDKICPDVFCSSLFSLSTSKLEEEEKDMMEEDEREEIHEFFKGTNSFSFDEARVEFSEEEFSDNEIRLLRIDFISKVAN